MEPWLLYMPCAILRQYRRRAPRLSRSPKTQTTTPGPRSQLDSTVFETKIPSPKMRLIAQAPSTSRPRRCSLAQRPRRVGQPNTCIFFMVELIRLSVSPNPPPIMSSARFWSRTSSPMAIVICAARASADVVRAFQTRLAARGRPLGREQALTRQHPRATKLPQRARWADARF
jgi:hypothetical protein